MKVTSVLFMEQLEPSVEFWTKRLGFEVTVTVPQGERLGFAILKHADGELMLQSHASVEHDVASMAEYARSSKAALFIEVADFDDVVRRLDGIPPTLPVRTTFYGMKEIGVMEPGGNFVIFACPVQQ